MKATQSLIIAVTFWLSLIAPSLGGIAVTDWALIGTNVRNAKRDLIEQLFQFDNQVLQIEQLVSRVKQAEDLLKRMGNPGDIKDLPGFGQEVNDFLREIERSLPSFEIIRKIDPNEVFQQDDGSPYRRINKDIIIDGKKIGEVNGNAVKPELAIKRTIAHYQEVRNAVLEKRSELKGDLELTMTRLKNATTTAEVDKLNAVINGLQTQLAANDADMQFAASEVATRHYQNLNEERLRKKVQVQKDRADLQHGMRKHLNFFTLPSRPALFKPRN